MIVTKYEHACLSVESDGQILVVDPGGYTSDFFITDNITAVVVTHKHADHLDTRHLQAIVDQNPSVMIYAHRDVTRELSSFRTTSVVPEEGIKVGEFELEFYGGEHAIIHPDIPRIANLGVMINGRLYYPGDSFTLPERAVDVLAVPVSAPWMKLSEAIDFVRDIQPTVAFPTHDALLSSTGKMLVDTIIPQFISDKTKYIRLSEPLEIA